MLAELLVGEHDVHLAVINAVLGDVAAGNDVEKLRREFREEVDRLEQRIDGLEEHVARLEKRVDMLSKSTLALNTPILVAVIGIQALACARNSCKPTIRITMPCPWCFGVMA